MGYIYKITNLINQKPYVGKTIDSINARWRDHVYDAFTNNSSYLIHQAMRKYGIENFKIEDLEQCHADKLSEREQYWIKTINSHFQTGYGYNMTYGGDGALKYTDEQILKLWNQGLKSYQIAEALGAKEVTISMRLKDLKPGEARQRHYDSMKKSVLQYDLDGNFIKEWESARLAEKTLNISQGNITKCCKGEYAFTKNSFWKYATDDTPIEDLMMNYALSIKCRGVDLIDEDGNILEQFESAAKAERAKGIMRGKVSEVCNNKRGRKTAGGYRWQWSYPLKRQLLNI